MPRHRASRACAVTIFGQTPASPSAVLRQPRPGPRGASILIKILMRRQFLERPRASARWPVRPAFRKSLHNARRCHLASSGSLQIRTTAFTSPASTGQIQINLRRQAALIDGIVRSLKQRSASSDLPDTMCFAPTGQKRESEQSSCEHQDGSRQGRRGQRGVDCRDYT